MITADEFTRACQDSIGGYLWDSNWNENYTEVVSLSIREMRELTNLLLKNEGSPVRKVMDQHTS